MPILDEWHRVPPRQTLLISEWAAKTRRIVQEATTVDVDSLSGVLDWILKTVMAVLEHTRRENLSEVWPHLEVFFRGGISFDPYRG